jgi:hypothetical protein
METHRRAVESNPVDWSSLLRIPIGMQRPSGAQEALRLSPSLEACRAYPSRLESVPLIAARAEPLVVLAGRPAAQGAADARAGGVEALLFIQFVINNNGGLIVREGTHASIL